MNHYLNDNYQAFHCPGDKGRAAGPSTGIEPTIFDHPALGSSYRFNAWGVPERWNTTQFNPNDNIANDAERIKQPSLFMLLADYNVTEIMWDATSGIVSGMSYPFGLQGSANAHQDFRVDPTFSMMFADGHADHFSDVKGEGGRGERFKVLPDGGW